MSDAELEQASVIAIHRWIRLYAVATERDFNHSSTTLRPKTSRIIRDPFVKSDSADDTELFLVPGGRYLVRYSSGGLCVWDLGYTSNADPKLLASLRRYGGIYVLGINTTSDRTGLIIAESR